MCVDDMVWVSLDQPRLSWKLLWKLLYVPDCYIIRVCAKNSAYPHPNDKPTFD